MIGNLVPEFGRGLGEINERVIATLASLLMTDESDTDTDVARPANTAGSDMPAIVSNAALFAPKVDMTRLSCAAAADTGRTSPRTVQTTLDLAAEKPDALILMLKKGLL